MKAFLFLVLAMVSFNVFAADAKVVATEPVYTTSTQHR